MTANINYQLARAIGWPAGRIVIQGKTVLCFEVVTPNRPLVIGRWRKFDHTDPVIADALVERYRLSVMRRKGSPDGWDVFPGWVFLPSRHRAIALAVIALEKK